MNKHLLAIFLILGTINFFSLAQIQPSYSNTIKGKQPNKAQLLKHLKNVKFTLQKHLKTMHDNLEEGTKHSGLPKEEEEDDDELAGMIFVFNLSEDFYKSSTALQQKISEFVTPTFNFICNNIKPFTIDELSLNFSSHNKSTFDRNTTIQLRTLFQSLYTKHYEIYLNSSPNGELTQMSADELFEQCLQFIIYTNELFIYESRVLLQKLDAKIKELSLPFVLR